MTSNARTPQQRFRCLLWDLIDATDVTNRARSPRKHKLAYAQWSMLNARLTQAETNAPAPTSANC